MKKNNSLNESNQDSYINKLLNKKQKNKVSNSQIVDNSNENVDLEKLSNNSKIKFYAIVGSSIVIVIVCILLISNVLHNNSNYNRLVCESNEGNIIIYYTNNELVSYKAKGIDFDFESHKNLAKDVGINKYIEDYTIWFGNNTTGNCSVK